MALKPQGRHTYDVEGKNSCSVTNIQYVNTGSFLVEWAAYVPDFYGKGPRVWKQKTKSSGVTTKEGGTMTG